MKRITRISSLLILLVIMFNGLTLKAQKVVYTTETFKVWGNCEMCKSTIEKSLKSINGIKTAKWNVDTKIMAVKFDSSKTSVEKIKQAVATSGYDTEEYKATEESYAKLHRCCQYDRK